MKKWILVAFTVMGTMAALFAIPSSGQASVSSSAQAAPTQCDGTIDGQVIDGNVVVQAGDSCTLTNTTVNGDFLALHGAEDITIFNSPVLNNIIVLGATGTVRIGVDKCAFDPTVGNNILVARSHNVAICQMTVDNNIEVRRNDGRIRIFENVAGNNIMVNDNLAYDPLPTDPDTTRAAKLRVTDNVAGGTFIFVRRNDRELVLKRNTPEPIVS